MVGFTPRIFKLAYKGLDVENRGQTTLAKQLALFVVLNSPIQMAADLPEDYNAHPQAFGLLKTCRPNWRKV